jgi:alkylation response protein AidB-like acyl-CoA dehydrogenase
MSPDLPAYAPSEEELLRETVRALADAKIAPHAAQVDESATFPQHALDTLIQADLHAVHIPEEYGGAGADALATVIVIEEVARACASSSLIPAVNKLGTVPILLLGSEDLWQDLDVPKNVQDRARSRALLALAWS